MPGIGGTGAATDGSGAIGSSSGGTAGMGAASGTPGGTPGGSGGKGGMGGATTSAGKGGTSSALGGMTSAGAAGESGRPGSAGAGLGVGGRSGAAGAASGAGGAAGAAGSGSALFTPVGALINTTCAKADCHGGKERPSLTNTNPTTLYNTLKSTSVRQCGSDRLATPNDPANSALLELVQHQCGTFVMPDGCMTNPCISAADIATITQWIQAGAPAP
jgi:hypothetical protein